MQFIDHLEGLRAMLIRIGVYFLFFTLAMFFLSRRIIDLLLAPQGFLIFTDPAESFNSHVLIALVCGIMAASPLIFTEVWFFIRDALAIKERSQFIVFCFLSIMFFLGGAVFGYIVLLPAVMRLFLSFASERIVPMITVKNYFGLVGSVLFFFGAGL